MGEKLFNPLEHAACLEFPLWLEETAWAEHIPFGMYLVSAMRPRILVELGAYRGASYCAFCQTVKSLQTGTKCFAVDTWQGDEHAGQIGKEILVKLRAHHDPLYADFSRLVQSTFDEALAHFADSSVDLLHIDGFHTYEAVRHDFETWLPKMSERGIVLFHDTNVRERGFGVWKFWSEVRESYSHFEFSHGHGLGVLAVGKHSAAAAPEIFRADERESFLIRKFFRELGTRIEAVIQSNLQREYIVELETYAEVVRGSRLMRAYRVLKNKGGKGLLKKVVKK